MKKERDLRESLKRMFEETPDPEQAQRVLDKITGGNRSVPDRLWVLRERIKNLKQEAEDLSVLLEYHSGSRLSQVLDHLEQAESLTEETISLTTGEAVPQ